MSRAYTPPRSSPLRRRRGRKSTRRSPRAYLQLRRGQKGRCVRFRAVSRAAVRWHCAQLRGRFPPRDRADIRAGRPVRPYPSPLEESPSRITTSQLSLALLLFLVFVAAEISSALLELELEHYNLGIRSQPQRRSPRPGSARSENLHPPDLA